MPGRSTSVHTNKSLQVMKSLAGVLVHGTATRVCFSMSVLGFEHAVSPIGPPRDESHVQNSCTPFQNTSHETMSLFNSLLQH